MSCFHLQHLSDFLNEVRLYSQYGVLFMQVVCPICMAWAWVPKWHCGYFPAEALARGASWQR